MAELVLKIGSVSPDSKHYQDGDILAAFNSRFIRCVHAQHICHVKNAGGGIGALRDNVHVARDWFEHTHQYRFERVSRTEIKRITLADMSEVLIDGTPKRIDGKMQHTDVALYVAGRLAHERHKIFGSPGREVWYGGRTDVSNAKLTLVWNTIETKTVNREIDFRRWPMQKEQPAQQIRLAIPSDHHRFLIARGDTPPFQLKYFGTDRRYHVADEGTVVTAILGGAESRSHLFVTVDDFAEAAASDLVSPELDLTDPDNPITIKKRRRHIAWRDEIPTREHADIEDKTVSVDLRETMTEFVRDDVVRTRVLARTRAQP